MTDLPIGTVTFLFTDIEGSTTLLRELRDRYADVLTEYQRLLRAAFQARGGREVDTQGDAFFIAFRSARDAVAAAIDAQRALANRSWPEGAAVRTRMGLHTGEAALSGGGYVGLDVHRAARICAAGHGGQVLLSEATRALIESDLPEEVGLRDLGSHRLKDLARPEHLYQLVVAGLPADFPPLKSLDILPNNLPRQLTSFVGREREIGEVKRLLSTTYLLSLTGVGGCGKTRLAIQVAADLLEGFPDGVWLVELAPLTDPDLVPQAVASALEVREVQGRPLLATLIDSLTPRHLLLLLDNCEHLLSVCAGLTDDLLRACPHLRILATSREALGISGELAYAVPSLSLPDFREVAPDQLNRSEAVRLFVERVAFSRPGFALTRENAAPVAQVCRRLDGIPLALELAAARAKALSVEDLAVRLDDRFRLLTGGSRTALPRQQTLQAAIDWSYDLLTEGERRLLRRLSVFAGGFTLEAVEAICSGDGIEPAAVLELVARLVEKSLVMAAAEDGKTLYRLLETVRQYARDRLLESGEAAAVRRRHLDWYVDLTERAEPQLQARDQVYWFERLEREHDNLRAALEWALGSGVAEAAMRLTGALRSFWMVRGYWTEARGWSEKALSGREGVPAPVIAKALLVAGQFNWFTGDADRAMAINEECLALYTRLGDRRGMAHVLLALAFSYMRIDNERAMVLLEESLALARETREKVLTSRVLDNLAVVAHHQGLHDRAAVLFEESLTLAREAEDKWVTSLVLRDFGYVRRDQGDYAQARALIRESLLLARELSHKLFIFSSLEALALMAAAEGHPAHAARLFGAAERLREVVGAPPLTSQLSDHEREVAALSASIGEAPFETERAEGRAMTLGQAISYALGEVSSIPAQPFPV